MKDVGIRSLEIVPFENVLEFMGRARSPATDSENEREPDSIILRGEALFTLTRPVKIRSMSVKLKGVARARYSTIDATAPVLPKLKQVLFSKTTLPAGEHTVPFMLEVPNIYPPSLQIKRGSIDYKLELSVGMGLQKKNLTAECPIQVRRHLLRCKQMAPLVETVVYEDTVPAKFHYEIDAPQIICLEQTSIPVAVKYLCFASQKPVRSIRTQLVQIELYRCHPNQDSNGCTRKFVRSIPSKKHIKATIPALIHTLDERQQTSTWKRPLILHHTLQPLITPALESPLVSIYHQLEISFQFEHTFESIRAKIPIVIASIPPQEKNPALQLTHTMPQYHFENHPATPSIHTQPENPMSVHEGPPLEDLESRPAGVHYSMLGEPRLPVTSSSINLHEASKEKNSLDYGHAIRKFASVNELSSYASLSDDDDDDDGCHENIDLLRLPYERPRTTTPIMQRRRHKLRPIDVDLANGINRDPVDTHLMVSKARLQNARSASQQSLKQQRKQQQEPKKPPSRQPPIHSQPRPAPSIPLPPPPVSNTVALDKNTVLQASSPTFSEQVLQTRPPSPVFSVASGLPAATDLLPQDAVRTALVEESFIVDDLMSPAMATVASSALFSPAMMMKDTCTTSMRRSKASSNGLSLSAVLSSAYQQSWSSNSSATSAYQDASDRMPPPLPPLPPLPPATQLPPLPPLSKVTPPAPAPPPANKNNTIQHEPQPRRRRSGSSSSSSSSSDSDMVTKRMTRFYIDDSDDEVLDPLPPIPEQPKARNDRLPPAGRAAKAPPPPPPPAQREPPQLPRLSLGTTFDVSYLRL